MKKISNLKFKISNSQGFTLLELLIVIAIIAILTSLLLANFIGIRQRARDAQRKSDLKQLQTAMELYRSDNGRYPCFDYGGGNCTYGAAFPEIAGYNQEDLVPKYIGKIPTDPVGNDCATPSQPGYLYSTPDSTYMTYTIFADLENSNDSEVTKLKPKPNAMYGHCIDPAGGAQDGSCKTWSMTSANGQSYGGSFQNCDPKYNYWVNNP